MALPISIVIAFFVFEFFQAQGQASETIRKPKIEAVLNIPTIVSGKIIENQGADGALLKAENGTVYLILPSDKSLGGVKSGEKVKMTLVPLRLTDNGLVVANFQSFATGNKELKK
ncbi:hypothetical protein HYY75_04175 [bacterium]|nr:hypothetical protein [bacterium]